MPAFSEVLQYPGGFEIELDDHKRRHVGLGSSSGTMCAVCIGINEALGRPFNNRELRRITGYNACEESPSENGYIIRTFETGIGSMVGINGGLVVGSDDAEIIYRAPLEDTKVIIIIPDVPSLENEYTGKDTAADAEVGLLLRRARFLDGRLGSPKAHMVLLISFQQQSKVTWKLSGMPSWIFPLPVLSVRNVNSTGCAGHRFFIISACSGKWEQKQQG